jgi:hypothetical protein
VALNLNSRFILKSTMGRRGLGKDIPKSSLKRAKKFNTNLNKLKCKVQVLLLGLYLRNKQYNLLQKTVDQLNKEGCNIALFHEIHDENKSQLNETINRAIELDKPDIIVCIITQEGIPKPELLDSICTYYGYKDAKECLRFCIHKNLNFHDVVIKILDNSFSYCQFYEFDQDSLGLTLKERIHSIVLDEVVRQFCPPKSTENPNAEVLSYNSD